MTACGAERCLWLVKEKLIIAKVIFVFRHVASAGFLHLDLIRGPSAISTSIVLVDIWPQVFFDLSYLIEDKGSPGAGDDGVEERRGHVSPFPPLGGRAVRRRWQQDFTF